MKTKQLNHSISRRDLIKSISLLGAGLLLPKLNNIYETASMPSHYVGFGGAGSNIVEALHQTGAKGRYSCISSPARPGIAKAINFIELNLHENRSAEYTFGFENYLKRSRQFQLPEEVSALFNSHEKYVLFAGLGGLTGSLLIEKASLLLHENKIDFKTIVSLPFSYEGSKRKLIAETVVKKLSHLSQFKYIALDDLRRQDGNMKIKDAFARASQDLIALSYAV